MSCYHLSNLRDTLAHILYTQFSSTLSLKKFFSPVVSDYSRPILNLDRSRFEIGSFRNVRDHRCKAFETSPNIYILIIACIFLSNSERYASDDI